MTSNLPKTDLTKISKGDDEVMVPSIENSYSAFFDQLSELQDDDIIIRGNCKFCLHPARQEFELKWEQTKNQSAVLRFINHWVELNGGDTFNPQNVRSHLLNHYDQQERQIWKREYLDRLSAIMNYKISKDQTFEFLSNGLQAHFVEVAADPTIDVIKKADTMTKLTKEIGNIAQVQAKLRGDIQGTQLLSEKFIKVYTHLVATQSDPNRQRELIENLDMFREEIGEMSEISG